VVLHFNKGGGTASVEQRAKVRYLRLESHCVHRKHTSNIKLDREDLVSACYLDGDKHGVFIVWVQRRAFVVRLVHEVFGTVGKNGAVGLKFEPDFKGTISLDVAQSGVELQIGLEILR